MGLQDDMKTLLAMDAQAQKETFTPSHPFTPDVVAWLERSLPTMQRAFSDPIGLMNSVGRMDEYAAMLTQARQILAAMGREEPRFVRVPQSGRRVLRARARELVNDARGLLACWRNA